MNSKDLLTEARSSLHIMGVDIRARLTEMAEVRRTGGLDANHEALWHHTLTLLRQVEAAEEELNRGHYGVCRHCHQPISPERMLLVPYADSCMRCHGLTTRRDYPNHSPVVQ